MAGDDRDERVASWRRLLAAIASLALGVAACGGGLLWALGEMRSAKHQAMTATVHAEKLEEQVTSNKARIAQLEAAYEERTGEAPPAVAPAVTAVRAPAVRSRAATTPTTASSPPTTGPPPTTAPPQTTSPPTTAAPPTTQPCTASVAGRCLVPPGVP